MLVVLGIILTLSVLTVLFMPRIQEQQRVRQGADLLQEWLLTAKQRALRDRVPTGILLQRISQDQNNPNYYYVRDIQYIQKPDDYAQGSVASSSGNEILFKQADFQSTNSVQPGDYLLLHGGEGIPTRIMNVRPTSLVVLDPPLQPVVPGSYRILRQPRPLAGEQPLQLPQDVVIDLSPNPAYMNQPKSLNTPLNGQILFSPSGRVVGQGTGNAPIALWLRDVTRDDPNQPGEQILMVIYPVTGQIAAHSVAQGTDPYQFMKDGRSSGF
jgi:hypothetical protein